MIELIYFMMFNKAGASAIFAALLLILAVGFASAQEVSSPTSDSTSVSGPTSSDPIIDGPIYNPTGPLSPVADGPIANPAGPLSPVADIDCVIFSSAVDSVSGLGANVGGCVITNPAPIDPVDPIPTPPTGGNGGGGNGGNSANEEGGGRRPNTLTLVENLASTNNNNNIIQEDNIVNEKSPNLFARITGAVVGIVGKIGASVAGIFITILGIVTLIVYNRKTFADK